MPGIIITYYVSTACPPTLRGRRELRHIRDSGNGDTVDMLQRLIVHFLLVPFSWDTLGPPLWPGQRWETLAAGDWESLGN